MDKQTTYEECLKKTESLLNGETDFLANMANVCALLKEDFEFWWVGFYLVKDNQLVLGPFQGPVACTRIAFGKGVCGTAWQKQETIVVPDVHKFEGHIACSEHSNSEIVVPLFSGNQCIGVLDIDSKEFNTFDRMDVRFLEKITKLLVTSSVDLLPLIAKK